MSGSLDGGEATYIGEFEYIDDYAADAPETGDGPMRKVIVFRLRPIDATPEPSRSKADLLGPDPMTEVPVEQAWTESMLVEPNHEPRVAERREQRAVRDLLAFLVRQKHEVCRLQLRPDGEPAPLFCDLYDKSSGAVYEAKGSVARPAVRMAIGQLADYARLIEPAPRRVMLLPERPRADLLRLASIENITV